MKNSAFIIVLVTTAILLGCSQKMPAHTSSGEVILVRNISLYRSKPHIWPAKGKLVATKNELLFIPTPHYWVLNLHGRDTTVIEVDSIEQLHTDRWMLVFPFRLDVKTDSNSYPFVTVKRDKLAKEIRRLRD